MTDIRIPTASGEPVTVEVDESTPTPGLASFVDALRGHALRSLLDEAFVRDERTQP